MFRFPHRMQKYLSVCMVRLSQKTIDSVNSVNRLFLYNIDLLCLLWRETDILCSTSIKFMLTHLFFLVLICLQILNSITKLHNVTASLLCSHAGKILHN